MTHLKGIQVILIHKIKVSTDPLNKPIYEEKEIAVDNVLVAPLSTEDVINSTELDGKRGVYELAIPKGDTNIWEDTRVKFFGKTWKTFGIPLEGIEDLLPLDWNKKVKVELYE